MLSALCKIVSKKLFIMKNLNLTALLIIITLIFMSCTQEDNLLLEEPTAEDLLKSFDLDVSAKGDFSLVTKSQKILVCSI